MMDVAELQNKFAMPGVLDFEKTASGMVVAHIKAPHAKATVYLQGAHLTDWQPTGQKPVLFLSARSSMMPGKAIRGGVPVIFPWFGERHDGKTGPQHGFARTSVWELAFAALAGEDLHLTFTLEPTDVSRDLGFDHFKLVYQVTIGRKLTLELTVGNDSGSGGAGAHSADSSASLGAPLVFEEALHTYYAVADARKVSIDGLGGTSYLDKVDDFKRKVQAESTLTFAGRTDRPYLNTTATCILHDPAGARKITVAKTGSKSTVVWNPWSELTATMVDMEPNAWINMTAVETANVAENAVTLKAGETHAMRVTVSVEEIG
jgi:glucose-6-phosphate 1-epimerase